MRIKRKVEESRKKIGVDKLKYGSTFLENGILHLKILVPEHLLNRVEQESYTAAVNLIDNKLNMFRNDTMVVPVESEIVAE